jgi:adaptin ear-binding coat-associated protein 1/2
MNPPEAEAETPSPHLPAGPKKDYSLKDGQTFSITIPGKTKTTQSKVVPDLFGSGSTSSNAGGGSGGAFPLLPPPPGR